MVDGQTVRLVRAGDGDYYSVDDQQFLRVSAVLDMAKGHHLMMWHAKQAALRAAAPLVHAGLATPDAELNEFVDNEPMRALDATLAVQMAVDWKYNMREPMRYRDWRGAVGSLTHAAREEFLTNGDQPDWIPWMADRCKWAGFFSDDALARFERLGYDLDRVALDAAHSALPHWKSLRHYIRDLKPDYRHSGVEMVCVNETDGWAGTIDGDQVGLSRRAWEKAKDYRLAPWPMEADGMLVVEDLKTSNTMQSAYWVQVAAYANAEYVLVPQADGQAVVNLPGAHDGAVIVHTQALVPPNVHFMSRERLDWAYRNIFLPMKALKDNLAALDKIPTKAKRQAKPAKQEIPF